MRSISSYFSFSLYFFSISLCFTYNSCRPRSPPFFSLFISSSAYSNFYSFSIKARLVSRMASSNSRTFICSSLLRKVSALRSSANELRSLFSLSRSSLRHALISSKFCFSRRMYSLILRALPSLHCVRSISYLSAASSPRAPRSLRPDRPNSVCSNAVVCSRMRVRLRRISLIAANKTGRRSSASKTSLSSRVKARPNYFCLSSASFRQRRR